MDNLQGGTLALEHRYDVLKRADRHGFITLYHGSQEPFGKTVWIKAYHGLVDIGADNALFERIKDASQVASELDADGVLRIIDYGELEGGIPFVISERTEALPLSEHLSREGTLSAEATATLLERLAQILTAAHDQGIAHGSLAPRWVYVVDDHFEEASIGHFQLAVTVQELLSTESAVMTADAVSAFAPEMFEQADSDEVDAGFNAEGDIWALGVLAYTALVGVHPFFEDELDASEGILRLRHDEPRPLSELGLDDEISEVVARALQKDPSARFKSVAALSDAFAKAVGHQTRAHRSDATTIAVDAPASSGTQSLGSSTSDESAPPSVRSRRLPLDEPNERQPGPSDRLMTLVIVLLILTNLAWFFYMTGLRPDKGASQTSPNKPASTSVVSDR